MVTPPPMARPPQQPDLALNGQQLTAAVQVGLKMLQSEDISSPNAWRTDLGLLEQILVGLLTNKLRIIPTAPQVPAKPDLKPFPREVEQTSKEDPKEEEKEDVPVLELETLPHADREA